MHRWKEGQWEQVQTLPLPGSGWDRESQVSTLMAADIQGDAKPEFLVRGARGLFAYTLEGRQLPIQSQSFTDAQGWNLTEEYGTMHTGTAVLKENGKNYRRTLILGRGSKGLEVYKFTGQWADAADSNFPQYCTNFNNDSSPQCLAYKAISGNVIVGQVDIRSQYTQADLDKGFWLGRQDSANTMNNPNGPNTDPNWQTVHSEMVQELGYVATVRGWFHNNLAVLNGVYGAGNAASELDQAVGDVDFATSKSVVAKWLEMGGDVVAGLARFTDGGGKSISLILTILKDTFNNVTGSNGDIDEEIETVRTDLNNQANLIVTTNATEQTGYLTNYSKLQQIGQDSTTGGYDRSDATASAVPGCNGNGSTTGIESGNQTFSQRLTVAQQNTRHITATEAIGILADIRKLKQEVTAASADHDIEIDLASPLREAANLIERAKLPAHRGSVSATTPTHLIELFVRRAQLHKGELGQGRTEYLLTRAYDVIADMEGQNQPGDAVTRCSR